MKVGPLFIDSIHTEKISRHHFPDNTQEKSLKNWLFLSILFGSLTLLVIRLFLVQIVNGGYYRSLSDSNRIRTIPIHAPRGVIFDRNNKPLVMNVPGYRETINGKTTLIDSQTAIGLLAKGDTNLEIDSLRMYPCKDACSHVVGYIGQISPQQLKDQSFLGYRAGDLVGKMGAEGYYESLLRGIDGAKLVEVDALGKQLRVLGETDPVAGQNITLTIDSALQQVVSGAMKSIKKGAVIVSNPKGEILALYSQPSFDPNLFTMGKSYSPDSLDTYKTVSQILTDSTYQPLLNRAISGTYPPGSTFKLVVAAAALQNHIIDSNFTITDPGILRIGNFSFSNWYYSQYGKTDGEVNVVKALQRSNDIFFYKVGEMIGVDRLSGFAKLFGLGSKTGIDLKGEASGLLPTKEWKQKVIGDTWYLGDDYHYGIGQGYLLTTPLQVNLWTQAVANGGTLYAPHILKSVGPVVRERNLLTNQNTSLIRQGMIEACDTGGVAWPLFNFRIKNQESRIKIDGKDFFIPQDATSSAQANEVGVRIACKTGTAQHGGETTLPHAWITLFAPAYNPQIIVTVLAENSGEGSTVAGPVAKKILQYFFQK